MKKTLNINAELLACARDISGAKTDTETIELALREFVRRGAAKRLAGYFGAESQLRETPRRRLPKFDAGVSE